MNNTTYNVYVFSVDVSADSSRFETLNTFFNDHFKVWLVEQTATIVPIWPPIIERGDWISFSPKGQVYCSVESGNDSPKVFTYTGSNALDVPVRTDASGNNSVQKRRIVKVIFSSYLLLSYSKTVSSTNAENESTI